MPGKDDGKSVHQDYRQSVRDVYNADNLQINQLGSLGEGAGGVPDKAILAPTLIDRGLQLEPLRERLEAMLPEGGALLVVVPGHAADYHEALVVRCGLVSFVEEFGGQENWQYLKILEWPDGAETIEAVLRKVRDGLGLDKTYRQADLERAVARHDRHLCFGHLVDGESWAADGGALVRRWVDYFESGRLRTARGRLVVGFLCLEVLEDPTTTCRQIQTFLDQQREKSDLQRSGVLVTKPLGLIRPKDLVEWRSRISDYFQDDIMAADLLHMDDELFPPGGSHRRLREIWSRVRDAVAEAVRRRPARFADPER